MGPKLVLLLPFKGSGQGSNGNEEVLHIPPPPELQDSSLTIKCSLVLYILPLCWDTVGLFYNPSWMGSKENTHYYK